MKAVSELLHFEGRRVMITGAASGIGRAMAARFAEAGAGVVLVDCHEGRLSETAAAIPGAVPLAADLADEGQIRRLWDAAGDPLPDTLINNAGIYPRKDFLAVDAAFLDHIMAVNLKAMFWMCREFISRRGRLGGSIINVASIEALMPFVDEMVPYAVTKAGVVALTRGLARDYGRQGFRANVLIPGAIKTPSTRGQMTHAIKHVQVRLAKTAFHFQARLSLGRWGEPDEVAKAALFLASDLASYVQGALIPVDGGFLCS